jgi:murein DD-endopeptidase MepM/ murein hydrolase activator NlpD
MIYMAAPVKGHKLSTAFGIKGHMWSSGRHEGVDYACPVGTDILAPVDAKVEKVGQVWGAAFGHHSVLLKVEGGYLLFAHCSKALVKAGDHVKKGQHIAESGADGNVTGPHLHMEYQKGPGWVKGGGMNPQKFIDA